MKRYMRIDQQPLEEFYYDNWYNDIITLFAQRKCNDVMFFDNNRQTCAFVYLDGNDIYWWSIVHTSVHKTDRQMQLVEIITLVDKPELEVLGVKNVDDASYTTDEIELADVKLEMQKIMRKAQAQRRADLYAKNVMRKHSRE